MTCTKGSLFCFGEEFVHIAVQTELSYVADGNQILWPDFSGVKNVEIKLVLFRFRDDLDSKFPLGIAAVFDGFHQILPVEIRILTSQFKSFIPDKGVDAELRRPDELDEVTFAFGVDQSECWVTCEWKSIQGYICLDILLTPKPCIIRYDRGIARSLIVHMNI